MANKGWISIHRKIEDDWLWNDKPFSKGQAWIDLLLIVNHEDKKILFNGDLIEVKRGQRITSIKKLCERWGWSNTKVKNFLNLLVKDNKIKLEITPRKTSALTIVNYSKYQDANVSKNVTETSETTQRSVTETSRSHINNNDNNENNEIIMIDKEKLLQKFNKALKNKTDMSVLSKNINKFGLEKMNLLSDKVYESEWLTNKLDLNILGKDVLDKAIDDFYKDKEERSDYDWYEPIEL